MKLNGSPSRTATRASSWLRAWSFTVIAGLAFAVVAGVTGYISYLHIQELTLALHQPASVARIMPFGVDGLIVVGSVALLKPPKDQEWLGWVCVGPGAVVSVFANVESGIQYGMKSAAWAGVASGAFILAMFALERWLKGQVTAITQAGSEPSAGQRPEDAGGQCRAATPEVPHPLTTLAALEALLASTSERELAFVMKVDRNKVRAWQGQVDATAAEPGDPEDPELQPTRFAFANGSTPDA